METTIDLSGKNTEELLSIRDDLNEKQKKITMERNELSKILRLCDSQLKEVDKDLKLITKEIKRREEIEEAKNIITTDISSIEGFESLSEDELSIITKNMDKTDYRKNGSYPRFNDLEKICKAVINMKKRYPTWILTNLAAGGQLDTFPPQIFYKYEYKDENDCYFNLGGIQVVRT